MSQSPHFPVLRYRKHRLNNGLDLILLEDHRLPLVAVNIWYRVGAANERPGRTGFAHLFEHMMFEGSKHAGEKAHFLYLEAAGASVVNGTTDFDRTTYFETLPSNQLELALWLESDRMGFLLDTLDERKLETQRDVVRNERRQVIENVPYGLVQEEVFHQLFPKDHPYHASVIGSHADIEAAQLSEVRDFFQLYYAPNNASLAIVGDIDPDPTVDLVEKYFGPIPAGRPVPRPEVETPTITSEKRVTVEDQVELPRIYLAWITDPILSQADAECDLIARILAGGKSSRLYRTLVHDRRIAQEVSAQQYSLALGSVFMIQATAKPGIDPQELEDAVRDQLQGFQREGPTRSELEGSRNVIEASIIRGLEHLGGFGGVADRLNLYNHFAGNPGYLAQDLERYYRATPESLCELARRRLKREAGVVVYGVSGKKTIKDVPKSQRASAPLVPEPRKIPDQDWRSLPPRPGPTRRMNLPVPEQFKLSNGLTVFWVEQHNLPIVSANVIVLSGSDRNPPNFPGLASFTADMLDEGTIKRSSFAIAADADRLGASLSTGSTSDCSYVALRTLAQNTESAFELLADVLLNPAFPPDELERVRHDRLTHILQQKDNPATVATKVLYQAIYGSAHPYGYLEIGTQESIRSLARDHLVEFYRSGYLPSNSALVVAGDIKESELYTLASNHLAKWSGAVSNAKIPEPAVRSERRIIIVDRPDAAQTVLRIGHIGTSRSSPDYVALEIMNTALGGLFSSRINMNLREKHGFTYGASSAFVFRRGPGPFVLATAVRTDATARALAEILDEMQRIRESEISPAELELAKDSLSRSLPALFETTPEIASSIGELFIHDLPLTYYHDLPSQIHSVSAAEVLRVARLYLRPDEAVIVAVGDRHKIEDQLAKLNLGPVEILDSQQNPTA